MDKLEKFVFDRRQEFDIYQPSPKVWQNIETNLKKHKKPSETKMLKILWQIAAAVLIFAVSFAFNRYFFSHTSIEQNKSLAKADQEKVEKTESAIQIPEILEAEAYYGKLVSSRWTEIQQHLADKPLIKQHIENDMSELDSAMIELKRDLADGVSNVEVVDAMIQNYRLKLELLEDLLHQLKHKNNSKNITENDEKQFSL